MSIVDPSLDVRESIDALLSVAAATESHDRRVERRFSFCCAATVVVGESKTVIHALTRDISESGIGLIHCLPLPLGRCELHVTLEDREPSLCTAPIEVIWRRPCGHGWYLSGSRFLLDRIA